MLEQQHILYGLVVIIPLLRYHLHTLPSFLCHCFISGNRNSSWRDPRERSGYDAGYEGRGRYDDYRDRPPYERGRFHRTPSGSWEEGAEIGKLLICLLRGYFVRSVKTCHFYVQEYKILKIEGYSVVQAFLFPCVHYLSSESPICMML